MSKNAAPVRDVLDHVTHARRGGGYTFVGWGTFQAEQRHHEDYAAMSVYVSDEGVLAVRPKDEFVDGRFLADPKPTNAMLAVVEALASAIPGSAEHGRLLAEARALAARSIVLTENALLHGREAFDAAKSRPASKLLEDVRAAAGRR